MFFAGKFNRPITLAILESGIYIPVYQWQPMLGKESKDSSLAKSKSNLPTGINWKCHLSQAVVRAAVMNYHQKKAEDQRLAKELFEKKMVDSLFQLSKKNSKDSLEYFSKSIVDAGLAGSSAVEPYRMLLKGYYTQRIANGLAVTETNRKYIAPFYLGEPMYIKKHSSYDSIDVDLRSTAIKSKSSGERALPLSKAPDYREEREYKSSSVDAIELAVSEPVSVKSDIVERKKLMDASIPTLRDADLEKKSGISTSIAPGQITAGIWNDVDCWDAFKKTHEDPSIASIANRWGMRFNRQLVKLSDKHGKPLSDASVQLMDSENQLLWSCKTDNRGLAVLYMDFRGPLEPNGSVYRSMPDASPVQFKSIVSELKTSPTAKPAVKTGKLVVVKNGQVFEKKNWKLAPNNTAEELQLNNFETSVNRVVDICLVVDATGSMGDELHYLKSEMMDVMMRAQNASPCAKFRFSSVFYRDLGDAYVTVSKPFTDRVDDVIEYVNQQSVGGGGDFPEAMDSAMAVAVNGMQWSSQAISRIIFLVLDAPAHDYAAQRLRETIEKAAKMGIKIIPIAASGIDKNCEFLFKYMATATYGDYVYITDHSGIGNGHLKPTGVKENKQYLNDLMVDLISKYSQFEGCDNQSPTQMEPRVELFGDQDIHLQAYPNPAISDLAIQCNELIEAAELTTLDGRIIKLFDKINSKNTYISVDGLSSGIYVLRCKLVGSTKVYTTKIMAMPVGNQMSSHHN